MPRVLQVLSSLQTGGGVQVMLKNYYAQLAPLAFQTDFVVCGTERGGLEPWFEALGAEIHHIPPRSEDPAGNLRALRRILADGHYDVVHCHQDYHGAAAMAMARRCGVPVRIIHSHQAYPPESALKRLRRRIESPLVIRDATVLAACGELAGAWLYGQDAVDSGRVVILRNAIDTEAFAFSPEDRLRLRRELSIPQEAAVIGHSRRLVRRHGAGAVRRAAGWPRRRLRRGLRHPPPGKAAGVAVPSRDAAVPRALMHMEKLSGKKIAKNMMLSVLAQAVSVLVGFVLNLIVPKFIPESDYSLWQSYLLYSQYLGVLHFGLMDGIVLRYARFDYDELDKDMVRSQYRVIMELDLLLSAGLLAIGCLLLRGDNRVLCILLACTVCIEITFNYISFTFQITNRITHYVAYIAVYRVIYCLLVLGCLAAGQSSYIWFCLVYLAADVAVILFFGLRYSRRLLVGSMVPRARLLPELRTTLSAGVWLMLSSYAANFLVGSGKMVIQWRWGLLVFGKVSLAFSLTSFFLQFVTAISVVLFPSIKRMEPDKLPGMYCRIRQGISPLLFAAMLLYYPGCVLLRLWLPKYEVSVSYLGMLLPLIIYTSKVSLLTNNYLKAYQQERTMLRINASCVAAGLALFALGAWVLNSLTAVLLLVLLSVMLRSMLSEAAVMRIIHVDLRREFVIEFALTAVFLISTCLLPYWWGLGVYGAALGGYLLGKRRDLRQLAHTLRRT